MRGLRCFKREEKKFDITCGKICGKELINKLKVLQYVLLYSTQA